MLTSIVLLPLLGFLLNGILATRFGGNRVGKPFVTAVGCGLPIASFLLVVKTLLELRAGGWAPLVEIAYRWALIGDTSYGIAGFSVAFLGEYWLLFELTSVLLVAAVVAALAVLEVGRRDRG